MSEITAVLPQKAGNRILVALSGSLLAFLAYSCVYAFRKPFTVAEFEGLRYWGVSYQTLLIISQVTSYMISKFYGIRFIAELNHLGRFKTSLLLIGTAWGSLLLFGLLPAPYGIICLFINGFALGFMWGIVFSYLEGRRSTDFMGAVMAVSFIFAGGFTRSVAKWVMLEWQVSEQWMPFITGLLFAFPLLLLLWRLEKIPAPDEVDIRERTIRMPMNAAMRKEFLRKFGWGLVLVVIIYLFLTILRDVRDNYMAKIWTELGYGNNFGIFTRTETTISLLVLLVMAILVMIRRNSKALFIVHAVVAAGLILAGIASALFMTNNISGALWMQLVGLGLYMGYIPFNCIFFERLIATFKIAGNVGFLIYFADAFGYLGSVMIMLMKEFMNVNLKWSNFYSGAVIIGAITGLAGILLSFSYFKNKFQQVCKTERL